MGHFTISVVDLALTTKRASELIELIAGDECLARQRGKAVAVMCLDETKRTDCCCAYSQACRTGRRDMRN